MRAKISAEAKGRVRELAASLEITAGRMTRAIGRLPARTLRPWQWKGRIGAERAIAKIVQTIPVPPELRIPTKAVWRFLQPVDRLPAADPEDPPRRGFIVMGIIAGDKNREVRIEPFGMAATAHAIHRLLDRSAFRADPVAAMLEGHAALTWLEPDDGSRVFDLPNAQLPAAGGVFLATPGRFGPDAAPLAIARTWIANDQLHADQAKLAAAWRELIDRP